MLRSIFILLLWCFPPIASAFENLKQSDYVDIWVAERAISDGEIMELVISKDGKAVLTRQLIDYPDQKIPLSNTEIIDDLHLFTFGSTTKDIMYKLVLSGWKTNGGKKKIFGSVFLYRKGKLFNSFSVSFVPR